MNYYSLIAVLLLCFGVGIAQDRADLETQFWSQSAQDILAKTYPADWNEESAVIITDDRYQQYINSGRNVYITTSKHQILKILDQSALEDFSEIKLDKDSKVTFLWSSFSKSETIIGVRLIKPDGSLKVIDIEKEEVTEDEVRKIAIPGLEIGDILDLFLYTKSMEKDFDGLVLYPPIESTIKDSYPILDYRIAIEVENDFFLNMNTYNGAPAVKEVSTDRKATKKYVVEAKNLDKIDSNRWYYPLVEEPCIKLQVAFARSRSNEEYANIFKGEDGERKGDVTQEDLLDFYNRKFEKTKKSRAKYLANHLKGLKLTDTEEMLRAALEYIRFSKNTRFFEGSIAHEAGIIGSYPSQSCYDFYFGRYDSLLLVMEDMRSLCMILGVTYDEILVQPRYDGAMSDLLIKANARRGLRINTPNPLYLISYDENMTFDRFPSILEGAEVYIAQVEKNKRVVDVKLETMPSSGAQDNIYQESLQIELNEDFTGVNLEREYELSGHFEDEYLFNYISWVDFLKEDYDTYSKFDHYYDCGGKKTRKSQKEDFMSLTKERQLKTTEYLKNAAEKEWEAKVENYQDTLIQTGRYGKDVPFIFKNSYEIKDKFIKKAGPNLIFEIGKFIGGQVEIDKKERSRDSNIYLDYAKTYVYNIDFKIPEGYTVKGIDKLNQNIDNNTGNFITTATVENGILKLKTVKTYKNNFLESSQWENMLPWLDAAFEFNQAKILLQKG